ncbi:MAG: 2OG-Fe(II) oxygenase [Imperialibacter sp.]|uniref:2OG-Fe(II) oxygenase n=1 Tax=Imperialibacter sp. TaxID=2038411 RepID=UPI0032EBB5FD
MTTQNIETRFNQLADDLSENGYGIIESFLSDEEVKDILSVLDHYQEAGDLKRAGIGQAENHQVDRSQRGDLIRWIEPEKAKDPTQVYLDRMRELMRFINRTCFLSLKDFEFHYTLYPVGTFYKRHLDQFKQDDHRKLSVICYLNFDWSEADGGQLRMYKPVGADEQAIDVLPVAGRMVCFRSDLLEHEVLPTAKERKSLTGWLRDQLLDVPF